MLSQEDNQLLTRTGRDTPMGQLMRQFWVPALLSEELPEPGGAPRKLRVMGEDLLAFRDGDGLVGVIDPVCPHRGANLYFGRNEDDGLRCVYHGWKFDRHGTCLEIPTAPAGSRYREQIRLTSYPARECGDIIWIYMGPDADPPPLPQLEFAQVPPEHRYVSKKWQDCNWAQAAEGALDTAHFSFLHMIFEKDEEQALSMLQHAAIGAQGVRNDRIRWVKDDTTPRFAVNVFDAGLVIGGARRADHGQSYWRITHFLMPNHAFAPSAFPGENYHGQTWVPHTDHGCWIYTYTWNPERPLTQDERDRFRRGHTVHAEVDEHYRPLRGPHNEYLIDRKKQKTSSFTGIDGVSEQDAAIQDSMGAIVDRSREHLGATDIGIVRFRQYILKAARELRDSGRKPEAIRRPEAYCVRSGGWVSDREKTLGEVMTERFGDANGIVAGRYQA